MSKLQGVEVAAGVKGAELPLSLEVELSFSKVGALPAH